MLHACNIMLYVGLNSIELIGPVAQDAFQFYFVLGLNATGHVDVVTTTCVVL